MNIPHIIILSLIQGVTEFLPISSSGHLMLLHTFVSGQEQGLAVDMAANMGTVVSILIYFRKDVWRYFREIGGLCKSRHVPHQLLLLIVATLPTVVGGALWSLQGLQWGRTVMVLGMASIIFGVMMGWVDRYSPQLYKRDDITLRHAFLMGCAQVFSLIPGASRSGTTVTMARFLGIKREDAFHFSFLMALPVTVAAALLIFVKAAKSGEALFTPTFFLVFLLSACVGWGTVNLVMPLFKRISLLPFAIYRVILGCVLLAVGYWVG